MSELGLRLVDIVRHYGSGAAQVRVLEGACLEVGRGEVVALVAPSGSGKSTLLHISGLLERAQSGEVEICGETTKALSDRTRTQTRRERIGYVYQFHHLLPEFTALENVAIPQMIAGRSKADAQIRAHKLLGQLGLAERVQHRPAELSGGEQQRVALARAWANSPEVLLADEPTGNLDPETSERVFSELEALVRGQGTAALIATHNYDLARRANRVVTLKHGKIVPFSL